MARSGDTGQFCRDVYQPEVPTFESDMFSKGLVYRLVRGETRAELATDVSGDSTVKLDWDPTT